MTRILWINPVGISAYDAPIGGALREEGAADTLIDVCSLPATANWLSDLSGQIATVPVSPD